MDIWTLKTLARSERPDIIEWIEVKEADEQVERDRKAARPIETPLGNLIPGKRYDITIGPESWGRSKKDQILRNVTPAYGSWGHPSLHYDSGVSRRLDAYMLKRIIKIEERPE
jgi:hypothetical protein